MVVRNAMEDFDGEHLNDEQVAALSSGCNSTGVAAVRARSVVEDASMTRPVPGATRGVGSYASASGA